MDNSFILACKNGNFALVKKLYVSCENICINDAFQNACGYGHLDIAKWIYELNTEINISDAFQSACINNQFEIANWLCESCNVDVVNIDEYYSIFLNACRNSYIELAKILYRMGVDIRFLNDYSYRTACKKGQLNIVTWLNELNSEITENNHGFYKACKHGHFKVEKWLYTENRYLNINFEYVFPRACEMAILN